MDLFYLTTLYDADFLIKIGR